jgi:hypothetical protein
LGAVASLLVVIPAAAQYPGQVSKDQKDTPELRSIAVLEWEGDLGKPKASRLVPVAVLDGGQLQDGGIYLARPEPLAVVPQVEYQLEEDGKPTGLFDIRNAGQQQGSWVGFGAWKPIPVPHRPSAKELARVDVDDTQSDEPVLHRKHQTDDAPAKGAGDGSKSGGDSGQQAPSDPDRPTLHKKSSGEDQSTDTGGSSGQGDAASTAPSDPDRPVLKKPVKKAAPAAEEGSVESVPDDTDPNRPRLKRGKASSDSIDVAPTLMGFPQDLQQVVAVSDARNRPAHPWDYAWANADDEAKMKASLEEVARDALGLKAPPAPAKAKRASTSTRKTAPPAPPPPPPPPPTLEDERYRVFELAYGSGATLVLSAHTDGPPAQQKFVTIVAQPDLYGNALVLLKNVTDGGHLDEKPRMRLVDAVDALADNRGELLFELRGTTQRQFALYRVLRGQAEQLFVTGGGQFGSATSE